MVLYNEMKRLIMIAVFDAVVYIKRREKRMWNLFLNERKRMYIETLNAVYKEAVYMESLFNLDVTNTI